MLTLEKEKRFALLASVDDFGGSATKSAILDNIQNRGYLQLNERDISIMPSRNEPFWRNNMAFVRKHLVQNRTLSAAMFNRWEITARGRAYLNALAAEVTGAPQHRILASQGLQRALHHHR